MQPSYTGKEEFQASISMVIFRQSLTTLKIREARSQFQLPLDRSIIFAQLWFGC
jgi:hypothetical protein